jgi:hypothetical protein
MKKLVLITILLVVFNNLCAQNKTWYDPVTGFTYVNYQRDGKSYVFMQEREPYSIASNCLQPSSGIFGAIHEIDGRKVSNFEDLKKALNGKYNSVEVSDYQESWDVKKPGMFPSKRTMTMILPNHPDERTHEWGLCSVGNCKTGYGELMTTDGYLFKGQFANGCVGMMVTPSGKRERASFTSTADSFKFHITTTNGNGDTCFVSSVSKTCTPSKSLVREFSLKGEKFYEASQALTVEEFQKKSFSDVAGLFKTQAQVDNSFSGNKIINEKLRLPIFNELTYASYSVRIENGVRKGIDTIAFYLNNSKSYALTGENLTVNNGRISGVNVRMNYFVSKPYPAQVLFAEGMSNDTLTGFVLLSTKPFFHAFPDGSIRFTANSKGMVSGKVQLVFRETGKNSDLILGTDWKEELHTYAQMIESLKWLVQDYYAGKMKSIPPVVEEDNTELMEYLKGNALESKKLSVEDKTTIVAEGYLASGLNGYYGITTGDYLIPGQGMTLVVYYGKKTKLNITRYDGQKCFNNESPDNEFKMVICQSLNATRLKAFHSFNIDILGENQTVYYVLKKLPEIKEEK